MLNAFRVAARERAHATKAVLAVVIVAAGAAVPASASNRAIVVSFEKHAVAPGQYVGTTDRNGTIEMSVYDSRVEGNVQHFKATLELSRGGRHLEASLDGRFNFSTERVVLNGTVTDGWLEGAQVHEESRLTGTDPVSFAGTIRLMPGSAD